MTSRVLCLCSLALVTLCVAQHDDTLTPGAKGADVVEATLTRIESACIFPDDKLLMRRMAYVESSDGEHPDTYRDGYHGGIWQVSSCSLQRVSTQTRTETATMEESYW